MSVSGLFLITFLLVHLCANMGLLFGAEVYNGICRFMDESPFITLMVPVLALGVIVHICFALWLTIQNRRARGNDRYDSNGKTEVTWASQNMLVLGIIIIGFLVMHLFHFWAKMQLQHFIGGVPCNDAYGVAQELFSCPVYSLLYIIWIVAIWFHLTHGFWSAFHTIGLSNNVWLPRLKCIAYIYATVVALCFIAIPLFFLFGLNNL